MALYLKEQNATICKITERTDAKGGRYVTFTAVFNSKRKDENDEFTIPEDPCFMDGIAFIPEVVESIAAINNADKPNKSSLMKINGKVVTAKKESRSFTQLVVLKAEAVQSTAQTSEADQPTDEQLEQIEE